MKWIASILIYLTVGIGLFVFHSAWGALLGFHAAILLPLLAAKPGIPISILFKHKNFKWIFISILFGGSSGVTLYFLWDLLGFASDFSQQVMVLGLNPSNWPMFILYFASVNPFVEEFFWRGYLGSDKKSLHPSDILYAGFHALILINKVSFFSILYALFVLTLAGWFWRQIAREEGGLLATVLGHMAADLTILLAVYKIIYN